jgi:hypothetical protein
LADIINGEVPTLPAVMPSDYMPVEGPDADGNDPIPFSVAADCNKTLEKFCRI